MGKLLQVVVCLGTAIAVLRQVAPAHGTSMVIAREQQKSRCMADRPLPCAYAPVIAALREGDLARARNAAVRAPWRSHNGLVVHHPPGAYSENLIDSYLFPEGEALRYLHLYKGVLSYVVLQSGHPVMAWEAELKPEGGNPVKIYPTITGRRQARGTARTHSGGSVLNSGGPADSPRYPIPPSRPSSRDTLTNYLPRTALVTRYGKRPYFHKPLIAFVVEPSVGRQYYQRITVDGKAIDLGARSVSSGDQLRRMGQFIAIPGEKIADSAR